MRPASYKYTEQHKARIAESNSGGKGSSSPEAISKRTEKRGFTDWKHQVFGLERELAAFKRCHNRVRDGKVSEIAWPRDFYGFIGFIKEIGTLHRNPLIKFDKPSVGRKDHSLGYIPGNIEWQEHRLNSILRKGTKYETIAYKGEK